MWGKLGFLINTAFWTKIINCVGDLFCLNNLLKEEDKEQYKKESSKFLVKLLILTFIITLLCI